MKVKKENVVNTYIASDNSVKNVLRTMFPDIDFEAEKQAKKSPVTERVKTFEDACRELGEDHPFVRTYDGYAKNISEENKKDVDVIAYLKLRIIADALNEGWKPQLKKGERCWFPWFSMLTEEELLDKSDEWKADRHLISIGDYSGDWAGFACANSCYAPSCMYPALGSHLCFKCKELAEYCGKQFISLWADFALIKK